LILAVLFFSLTHCSQRTVVELVGDGASSLDDPDCDHVTSVKPIKQLACSDGMYSSGVVLDVTGGQVVFTNRSTFGSNSATDLDLFVLSAKSGAIQQLTGDYNDTYLLGTDGDAVLFARSTKDKQRHQLYLRKGQQIVDLGSHVVSMFPGAGMYTYAPTRPVRDGRAAWRTTEGIFVYDGSAVSKVAGTEHAGSGGFPYLDGEAMVWSASDGKDHEIYLHLARTGKVHRLTDNTTQDRYPVLDGGRVFWSCDEKICTWSSADGVKVIDEGACSAPHAQQGTAVWICDNQVTLYDQGDPQELRHLTSRDADTLIRSGARVHSGRVLWLEHRDLKAKGYPLEGTLVLWDGHAPRDLAKVGLPCIYCSAYWPPLMLAISDRVVAWSYAVPGSSSKPPYELCAYAELETYQRCY
jgi:hypothetical protein